MTGFTAVTATGNIFTNTTGNTLGSNTSFTPPYSIVTLAASGCCGRCFIQCGCNFSRKYLRLVLIKNNYALVRKICHKAAFFYFKQLPIFDLIIKRKIFIRKFSKVFIIMNAILLSINLRQSYAVLFFREYNSSARNIFTCSRTIF